MFNKYEFIPLLLKSFRTLLQTTFFSSLVTYVFDLCSCYVSLFEEAQKNIQLHNKHDAHNFHLLQNFCQI